VGGWVHCPVFWAALLPSQSANLQDIVFTQNGPGSSGIEASERTFRRIVLTAPKRSAVNAIQRELTAS
jgi:hypothetical protein